MQHKTKNYIVLTVVLILASLFLITNLDDSNNISGLAIDELKLLSCAYANKGNTCFTDLERLDFITTYECCEKTGLCCAGEEPIIVIDEPEQECTDCDGGVFDYQRDQIFVSEYEKKRSPPIPLKGLNLPEGYSTIRTPFNVQCTLPTTLTLSLPSNYEDVKILKCTGDLCYLKVVEKIRVTYEGNIVINVTKETEEFDPIIIELEIEEIDLNITSFQDLIERGGTEFYGDFFKNLTKILYPTQTISGQDELTIIGGPFNFNKNVVDQVKLPFALDGNVHGEAIGLFARKNNRWIPVGSAIDQETKTILASIQNISELVGEDNISLAIMGSRIAQRAVNFEKIYSPGKTSRDAVILVHGLATTKETFKFLIQDIKQTKQPYQVWTFAYSSDRYIDEISDDLSDAIEKNLGQYDRIFIVAHSMGGIITQQALRNAYEKDYSYISNVKKAILIGTPNEGSIVAEAYEYLFSTLVQRSIGIYKIFQINERFIGDITKGRIIERIPDVEYYVIAGTGRYTEGIIGLVSSRVDPDTKFDGVVSVKSAQNIGGEYIDDLCKNYWEVAMTHMELVDDPVSRDIIGKIISEEVAKTTQEIINLGENKYYKIKVEECSSDIYYLAIGREITKEVEEEITLCSCGDDICGTGEDRYNCPSDCAPFLTPIGTNSPGFVILLTILAIISGIFILKKIKIKDKGKSKNKNKKRMQK